MAKVMKGDIQFEIDKDGTLSRMTNMGRDPKDVTIPRNIEGKTIAAIGEYIC